MVEVRAFVRLRPGRGVGVDRRIEEQLEGLAVLDVGHEDLLVPCDGEAWLGIIVHSLQSVLVVGLVLTVVVR